jgi:hypothetical protein
MQLQNDGIDIANRIRAEFAAVVRPEAAEIAPHLCGECEDVRQRLAPHAFDRVPDETTDYLSDSLPLLGPRGLHYYLPAYLLRTLRDPDWRGIDFLLYHLAPGEEDLRERAEYWRDRLSVFSVRQRDAVRAFISWFETTGIAQEFTDEIHRAHQIWEGAP